MKIQKLLYCWEKIINMDKCEIKKLQNKFIRRTSKIPNIDSDVILTQEEKEILAQYMKNLWSNQIK